MTLYSYVIPHDTGFAPNPFGGYCTLATCKPRIRQQAQTGDWIIGTGSVENVGLGKLVFAMQVAEVLSFTQYYHDPRFTQKKPTLANPHGDNIYYVDDKGEWHQHRSSHHGSAEQDHDLSGRFVLIASRFYYFGSSTVELPERFQALVKKGPGHKSKHDLTVVQEFLRWLETNFTPGLFAQPYGREQKKDAGMATGTSLKFMELPRARSLRDSSRGTARDQR